MREKKFIDKIAFIYLEDKKILMALTKGKDTYYIPGGKRDGDESNGDALVREVEEELSVGIDRSTIKYYGTFMAQAHGKPEGVVVRMICYTANFSGEIKPANEIQDVSWYDYDKREVVGPVDKIIFDDLRNKGFL